MARDHPFKERIKKRTYICICVLIQSFPWSEPMLMYSAKSTQLKGKKKITPFFAAKTMLILKDSRGLSEKGSWEGGAVCWRPLVGFASRLREKHMHSKFHTHSFLRARIHLSFQFVLGKAPQAPVTWRFFRTPPESEVEQKKPCCRYRFPSVGVFTFHPQFRGSSPSSVFHRADFPWVENHLAIKEMVFLPLLVGVCPWKVATSSGGGRITCPGLFSSDVMIMSCWCCREWEAFACREEQRVERSFIFPFTAGGPLNYPGSRHGTP